MKSTANPFVLAATLGLLTVQLHAQEIIKANNSDTLSAATSWVGGSVPGASNIAVWDATVTAANAVALGADQSWAGIKLTNPGGTVTIVGTNTLTLGTSGIDLSFASQNLTLGPSPVVAADQSWTVGSGRTLTASGVVALSTGTTLTLSGSGTVRIGTSGYATGSSGAVVVNGPTWILDSSGANRSGTTTLASGIISILNNTTALGTGGLILDGGRIGSNNATARTLANPVTLGGNVDFGGSGLSSGTMTFSGTTDLGGATRTLTTNVNTTFSGAVSNSNGGIIKEGNAILTLSGSYTFNGPITINAGSLNAGNNSGTLTLSGDITGSGALTRTGAGTVVLSGTNTYTGLTTVSGGAFILDGTLTSNISVTTASTRIGGTGTSTGSLTVGSTGTALGLVGGATTTSLTVNGATLDGPVSGRFLGAPVGGTTYDVLTYGAGGVINPANLTFFGRGTLNHETANNKFTFTASAGPETRTWAGGDGNWDTAVTANWTEGDKLFYPFDHAVFPDTASDITVNLTGNVQPSSVTVSHSANSITFAGTSSITGSGGLSKTGAGTFSLASNHSYTGPTTVAAGTFQLGNGGTTGIISSASTIDIASGATLAVNRSTTTVTLGNNISGSGTLLKSASNDLVLTGANSFSGLIDVQSGIFVLNSLTSDDGQPSVNVNAGSRFAIGGAFVNETATIGNLTGNGLVKINYNAGSNRTLRINQTVDGTFSGAIEDGDTSRILNITKAGPATLTLTGNNTYTGPTTIAGGTLVMRSRSMPASHFTLADSASLTVVNSGPQLTTGNFTLGDTGTSTLTLQGVATASGLALINCQALSTNGTTTIHIVGGYFPVGSHKLISYTSRTGAGGFAVGTLPAGVSGTIVDTGTSINLLVDSFTPLTWNGADNAAWDVDTSTNWKLGATTGLKFQNGEVARFDATAPGSTVVLDDFVEPLVTVFEFDAPKTYLLAGFGGIDSGDFVKAGTGTLTVETVNIHTGTTSVSGGTLVVGANGALGNAPGGVSVSSGATLDLDGFNVAAGKALTLSGGALVNSAATGSSYGGTVTFQPGNSELGGSGDLTLSAPFSGGGDFVKFGAGSVTTGGIAGDSNSFTGAIIVNEGTLNLSSTVRATTGLTVNPGATASTGRTNMFVANHGEAMATNRVLTVNGGTLVFNASMDARFGNVTLHNGGTLTSNRGLGAWDALFAEVNDGGNTVAGTLAVTGTGAATMNGTGGIHLGGVQNFQIADTTGNPDADLVVNMILDKRGNNPGPAGGINKLGAGTMRINSNSSYDGATIVTEGALIVAGSLTATSSVTVASGATLGGNGNIGGPVTVQSGGIHALEVAAEPGQQATRTITGALTLDPGNILRLATNAPPVAGTYILAVATGGITGAPGSVILPDGVSGTVAVNGTNLELTVGAASDYDTWAGTFTGLTDTAPGSDPDNDGLTNFEEYAFGLNPTSGSSVSPVTPPDKGAGTFTYTRRKQSLTGLTYTYQSSGTLAGWANFTPVSEVSNNGDPVETITVTLPAALLGGNKLFLRVEAQKP